MTSILIAGATGLLGSSLAPVFAAAGHQVLRHGNTQSADIRCDLSNRESTVEMVGDAQPDVIVNLVGLTDVDFCEEHPDAAYRANVLSIQNLCCAIKLMRPSAYLLHLSTDMVYDGTGPHSESRVTVRNTYALSKLAGELAAAQVVNTVLRTNFVGRSRVAGRASLSDWLFESLSGQVAITVFDDVFFSPLSITTLCSMLVRVVADRPPGLFNLGARDGFSKAQMAFELADRLGLSTRAVTRGSIDRMVSLRAPRPKDMRMDCTRFAKALDVTLPTLAEEIGVIAKDYHAEG
jgi:dTDP-4-dehydrorhamnose reductase